MKDIYTFGRKPAKRNYTLDDLRAVKGSGKRLTMCKPANETEIRACVDAGIDLLTVWDEQMEIARQVAPHTFMGTAMTWGQYATADEILSAAISAWNWVQTCTTRCAASTLLKCSPKKVFRYKVIWDWYRH